MRGERLEYRRGWGEGGGWKGWGLREGRGVETFVCFLVRGLCVCVCVFVCVFLLINMSQSCLNYVTSFRDLTSNTVLHCGCSLMNRVS
jgi:hypothetical protein